MNKFMPIKHPTPCCALCQITASNYTPFFELKAMVDQIKDEVDKYNYLGLPPRLGQRAIYVICSPGEERLEKNLQELEFVHITTFNRRVGYPAGVNKMYFLSF